MGYWGYWILGYWGIRYWGVEVLILGIGGVGYQDAKSAIRHKTMPNIQISSIQYLISNIQYPKENPTVAAGNVFSRFRRVAFH